jgi:hypothetical protein
MNNLIENQKILYAIDILDTYFMGTDSNEMFDDLLKIVLNGANSENDKDRLNMYKDMFIQVETIVREVEILNS